MINFPWIRKNKLNNVERLIIEELLSRLSPKSADILRRQVSAFNKIQRIDKDREIDFYCIKMGDLIP